MKVFVFDAMKCNGCYGCQLACKDEHCGNDWPPYSRSQPTAGHFWMQLKEKTHGQVPRVKLEYKPVIGAQDEALREYAPEVIQEREDGLIVIDPEKAAGRKDIADKFDGVYWNEDLGIPQGCTGCAHLVDEGEVPHCVDLCVLGALQFGDIEDFADIIASAASVEDVRGEVPNENTHVYYLNMPHLFIGGDVYDEEADEVIIGARISLAKPDGSTAETSSDEFGDFWFRRLDPGEYTVTMEADGYEPTVKQVDLVESLNIGSFSLMRK